MIRFNVFLVLSCVAVFSIAQRAQANQMSFTIGVADRAINQAYVMIEVCSPTSGKCKRIDKIKLDSGSEGLKVKSSALEGLDLDPIQNANGSKIVSCSEMAGLVGYLGTLTHADVKLGDMTAKDVVIEVADPKLSLPGVSCFPFPTDGRNGLLGMATALKSVEGKKTFACEGQSCRLIFPAADEQTENPIAKFPEHNNGFVLKVPAVSSPKKSVKGQMIFGVGTAPNNQPPSGLSRCTGLANNFFIFRYGNKRYSGRFDTGTFSYFLPVTQRDIPYCAGATSYLCPSEPTTRQAEILNADGSSCAKVDMQMKPYSTGTETKTNNHWALPGLTSTDGKYAEMFMLGMPFFFGRDVYFVLDKSPSTLGRGPLVAF